MATKEADSKTNSEAPEDQLMPIDLALREAEVLLRRRPHGVLCTLSKKVQGWPFGSVVPYAVDAEGRPLILIAAIAEHFRNIQQDDRVSLLVHAEDGDGDVQERGRLTFMGRASRVPDDELADARARYLARLPEADSYSRTHSFHFYRISVERLRYIGGFGKIFWLPPDNYRAWVSSDPVAQAAGGIVDHMNEDHSEALKLYCRAFAGTEVKQPTMTGVDRWGLDITGTEPQHKLRIDFDKPADMSSIRPMVVEMVNEARRRLGVSKS